MYFFKSLRTTTDSNFYILSRSFLLFLDNSTNKMDIIDGKSFASGEDEQRLFFERQREFSFKLLKTTNKCKKKDNVILSPYSIDRVLLMSYFGAANETKISLEKLLCLKNADKETVARSFRSKPNDDRHVEFVSADKCFVSNRIELK